MSPQSTTSRGAAPAMGLAARLRHAALRAIARALPRRVSAMMRVKNEEEFLVSAVRSIIDSVDEIVIVDNASTDGTAALIDALREEYPDRITTHRYPYEIARVGRETWQLQEAQAGRSPHLSGVYYAWCLRRCTQPYVLKWDGDMLATAAFHQAIAAWRQSHAAVLMMQGANLHPDRQHLAAARSTDRAALLAQQSCPSMPGWVTSMTRDYLEPHLFPRLGARYTHAAGFTQSLASPFLDRRYKATLRDHAAGVAYLHLKFCKRDPYANYSHDLARVIAGNLVAGPPLDAASHRLLERWELSVAHARRA